MRIQIFILGFKVNCIIAEPSFCLHLDEYPGMVWKKLIILQYGKHLQECTGNLAIKFAFFLFLIIINHATC